MQEDICEIIVSAVAKPTFGFMKWALASKAVDSLPTPEALKTLEPKALPTTALHELASALTLARRGSFQFEDFKSVQTF